VVKGISQNFTNEANKTAPAVIILNNYSGDIPTPKLRVKCPLLNPGMVRAVFGVKLSSEVAKRARDKPEAVLKLS
jgi:hypothetical protein